MPWDHDPAMAGWRRALEGWGKELEWKSVTDAWLECENDGWVRWSLVKAVNVRPVIRSTQYQVVLVMEMNEHFVWKTFNDKEAARHGVSALLQQLSHDYRQ